MQDKKEGENEISKVKEKKSKERRLKKKKVQKQWSYLKNKRINKILKKWESENEDMNEI